MPRLSVVVGRCFTIIALALGRFRIDISPDGESITMTSENTPNEPRVYRRAPAAPAAAP